MKGIALTTLLGLGGFIVGLVGIGYAIESRTKIDNICDKLNKKVDDISWNIESDISIDEAVVEEAIDRAVERKVERIVGRAAKKASDDIYKRVSCEVKDAVKESYKSIQKSVSDRLTYEVSKIDISDIKNEVKESAQCKVVEKFDGQLDDILEKFNNDLDNISKIYKSIATRITGDSSKDFKISLG